MSSGSESNAKVKNAKSQPEQSQVGLSSIPKATDMTMGQDSRKASGVEQYVKLQALPKFNATAATTSQPPASNPGFSSKAVTHCSTTHKTFDHGTPFRFRNTDPTAHTLASCSNETLDPCDYAERVQAFGNRFPQSNTEIVRYYIDEEQQIQDEQAAGALTPIPPLPIPSASPGSNASPKSRSPGLCVSQTTIGASFPSTLEADSAISLTPIPPYTANYFRSMGVPSRIYTCHASADPNQSGQFVFNLISPSAQGSRQSNQPIRPTYAIINVNNFNFPAGGPPINLTQTQNFADQDGGKKPSSVGGLRSDVHANRNKYI